MQSPRLFAHPARILDQLHFLDQFVPTVLPLPPKRVRIRPLLNFIPGKRVCRISRAGRVFRLMDVGALGREEPRFLAHKIHARLGERDALDCPHLRICLQQQVKILLDRRRERIHFVWRGPIGHRRRLRSQAHVLAFYARRCLGNLNRPRSRRLDAIPAQMRGCRKAPRAVRNHAHTDAQRIRLRSMPHPPVLGGQGTIANRHHPRIGIGRAARSSRIESQLCNRSHPENSILRMNVSKNCRV